MSEGTALATYQGLLRIGEFFDKLSKYARSRDHDFELEPTGNLHEGLVNCLSSVAMVAVGLSGQQNTIDYYVTKLLEIRDKIDGLSILHGKIKALENHLRLQKGMAGRALKFKCDEAMVQEAKVRNLPNQKLRDAYIDTLFPEDRERHANMTSLYITLLSLGDVVDDKIKLLNRAAYDLKAKDGILVPFVGHGHPLPGHEEGGVEEEYQNNGDLENADEKEISI